MGAIAEFIDSLKQQQVKYSITTLPGIEIAELEILETKLCIKLPDDLKEFYTYTNGLEGNEDYIFNIIPFNEVEKLTDNQGEYLIFAEYLIYSDTFSLAIDKTDSNKYEIFTWYDYTYKETINTRHFAYNSIIDFIKAYTEKGTMGLFYGDNNDAFANAESQIKFAKNIPQNIITKEEAETIGKTAVLKPIGIFIATVITIICLIGASFNFFNAISYFINWIIDFHMLALLAILLGLNLFLAKKAGYDIIINHKKSVWISIKATMLTSLAIICYATLVKFISHNDAYKN